MLREEPKLRYYYEVIEPITIPKEETLSLLKEFYPKGALLYKGELVDSERELDIKHFKKICTFRGCFIGDWQERLNKVAGCDLKEKWLKERHNSNGYITRTIYQDRVVYQTVWVPKYWYITLQSTILDIKDWFKSKFSKKKDQSKEDVTTWLFEEL